MITIESTLPVQDHMATVEEGDSKYLAPEVLNNPPTQAADIFSIGMSILEVRVLSCLIVLRCFVFIQLGDKIL